MLDGSLRVAVMTSLAAAFMALAGAKAHAGARLAL